MSSVPTHIGSTADLSNVTVTKSFFSGFSLKNTLGNLSNTSKFYVAQTGGALALALDGFIAGDTGSIATGLGNAAKNVGFFPIKKFFKKKYDEPESTLRADFTASAISTATNLPQMISNSDVWKTLADPQTLTDVVDVVVSGDIIRAISGFLAVSAYAVQTAYNAHELHVYNKQKKSFKDINPADPKDSFPEGEVIVQKSKLSGFVRKTRDVSSKLGSDFIRIADEKFPEIAQTAKTIGQKLPGKALEIRSWSMIAGGLVTGNPVMALSGVGFLAGALYRTMANEDSLENTSKPHADDEETEKMGETVKPSAPINNVIA